MRTSLSLYNWVVKLALVPVLIFHEEQTLLKRQVLANLDYDAQVTDKKEIISTPNMQSPEKFWNFDEMW